jgi:hypothetical protein
MRIAPVAALAALLTIPADTTQWAVPLYLSPERTEAGSEIGGDVGARDYDANATNTWATKAFTRACTPEGGCAGVSSASSVWTGFQAGYRPRKLIVYWKAASSVAMFGGMSQVRAVIDYSTKGDAWKPVDRFVAAETNFGMQTKASEDVLPPGLDPATIRVRGRLDVELISCPHAGCAANLPNSSNVSGQIWISDIRLEVEDPVLTASRVRVRKGEQVVFRVEGAPGGQVGDWTFTGAGGKPLVRVTSLSDPTWALEVAESGTVTATVRLRGQPQLEGRMYKLSKFIEARTRR